MQLVFPTNEKQKKSRPEIPTRTGQGSGWCILAACKSDLDLYVAFHDPSAERMEVRIEKASTLDILSPHFVMEMLQIIDSDEEFNRAHQYFVDEGVLDDISPKKP